MEIQLTDHSLTVNGQVILASLPANVQIIPGSLSRAAPSCILSPATQVTGWSSRSAS